MLRGANYVQFDEDGLAVLQYGDIDFATADHWVRLDFNVDHVEPGFVEVWPVPSTAAPSKEDCGTRSECDTKRRKLGRSFR